MLPHFRAAAFFVPLGPLEGNVHHYAGVREGTRLGHSGVGATICHLPQSGGIRGGGEKSFEAPVSGREAARRLLQLRQDSLSVADYAVEFRTLAAEGAWNPEALFDMFCIGGSKGRFCSPRTTDGS